MYILTYFANSGSAKSFYRFTSLGSTIFLASSAALILSCLSYSAVLIGIALAPVGSLGAVKPFRDGGGFMGALMPIPGGGGGAKAYDFSMTANSSSYFGGYTFL